MMATGENSSFNILIIAMLMKAKVNILLNLLAVLALQVSPLFGEGIADPRKHRQKATQVTDYPIRNEILVADIQIRIIPRREFPLKAASSGLLELYVDPITRNYEADTKIGGINTERLELDAAILEIEEALLAQKDIPEWYLSSERHHSQLKKARLELLNEYDFLQSVQKSPDEYASILSDLASSSEELETILSERVSELEEHMDKIDQALTYAGSDQKVELEIGMVEKKHAIKKIQFKERYNSSYLIVPFQGEVQFTYPYIQGEKNYIGSGAEIARVRDFTEIYAQVPMLDSEWRTFDKEDLVIRVKTAQGLKEGYYAYSTTEVVQGREQLIYYFRFAKTDSRSLRSLIGGMVNARLNYKLTPPAHVIPKLALIMKSPAKFEDDGWQGVLKGISDDLKLQFVGLNAVAVQISEPPLQKEQEPSD